MKLGLGLGLNRARPAVSSEDVFTSPLDYAPTLWLKASTIAQADASAVTSWADLSGNSNTATQPTAAKQPTYRTNVLNTQPVVRFDGGDGMYTGNVNLSATREITTFIVAGSIVAGADDALLEFSENYNTALDGFIVYRTVANKIQAAHKGNAPSGVAIAATSTPTFSGAGVFGIVVGQHVTSFSMQEVGMSLANNWRYQYTPTGAVSSGTNTNTNVFGTRAFNIGARAASGTLSLGLNGDIAEIIVYPRFLSGGEIQNVGNYLATLYGASLWNAQTANIVFEGDSLTEGDTLATSAWPHIVMGRLTDTGVWYCIPAVSGQTLVQMAADYEAQIKPLRNLALGDKNVITLWGGTNDMASPGGNVSAATALSRFYAYADTLRADGWYVIGITMIPRDDAGAPADFEAKRNTFNANVVANWASHFDAIAQPHLQTAFDAEADASNTTNYHADKVHLNATGNALVANDVETALAAIGIT